MPLDLQKQIEVDRAAVAICEADKGQSVETLNARARLIARQNDYIIQLLEANDPTAKNARRAMVRPA